jgi:hypothetical protein
MKRILLAGLILFLMMAFAALAAAEEMVTADLVLFNGRVFTSRASWFCRALMTPTFIFAAAVSICWALTCARPAMKKTSYP